mgnify:CR=1 FL=1
MKYFLLIWMLCPLASLHAAGPGIRIACYNAESLHDTIPDRLIDDGDYTPRGARQWNGERYRLKIGHIARVIDELDADLLLLTEIENESVLRDLMLATSSDYNYIHRHTSDQLRNQSEFYKILWKDLFQQTIHVIFMLLCNFCIKSDRFLINTFLNNLINSFKCTATDK